VSGFRCHDNRRKDERERTTDDPDQHDAQNSHLKPQDTNMFAST
jgi:hypothetical protein